MGQLERVGRLKDIRTKGQYYSERRVVPVSGNIVTKENQTTKVFITGQCPDCGSQFFSELDLSKEAQVLPCCNVECKDKFIYKENSMHTV